jgi:hypothetical protein
VCVKLKAKHCSSFFPFFSSTNTGDGKLRHGHFLGGVARYCAYKTLCLPCYAFW